MSTNISFFLTTILLLGLFGCASLTQEKQGASNSINSAQNESITVVNNTSSSQTQLPTQEVYTNISVNESSSEVNENINDSQEQVFSKCVEQFSTQTGMIKCIALSIPEEIKDYKCDEITNKSAGDACRVWTMYLFERKDFEYSARYGQNTKEPDLKRYSYLLRTDDLCLYYNQSIELCKELYAKYLNDPSYSPISAALIFYSDNEYDEQIIEMELEKCNKYANETENSYYGCLYLLVDHYQITKFCSYLPDGQNKQNCYLSNLNGVDHKTLINCEEFENDSVCSVKGETGKPSSMCLIEYARKCGGISRCSSAESTELYDACILGYLQPPSGYTQDCKTAAGLTSDVCDAVSSAAPKNSCYYIIAICNHNSSVCEKISTDNIRDECKLSILSNS